jgi:hypothetical protein
MRGNQIWGRAVQTQDGGTCLFAKRSCLSKKQNEFVGEATVATPAGTDMGQL